MSVRFFIAMALFLTAMIVLMLALLATDTALSVWQQLSEAPAWLRFGYLGLLLLITTGSMVLAWRWLKPKKNEEKESSPQSLSSEDLESDLDESSRLGIDISEPLSELREQRKRKSSGAVYIAVFGEISTGKSSLVKALLPESEIESDPRGGTTLDIRHYQWSANSGDRVEIADLPGFNLGDDPAVLEEARRAHLVVFLVSGDLTQSQHEELKILRELGKPVIIAFNKADRFTAEERRAIRERLSKSTGLAADDIVVIQSGGREDVVRVLRDGSESVESRERPVDVESLRSLIQAHLDQNMELMESLRDTAVLLLASEKLEEAQNRFRREQAEALVRKYSQRAVVGALAAVAPGSDLVIQGVLATRLIQELCDLYEVSVKEVQIESFLKLAGGKVRKMSALTMAISGNALKAFPGLGTLSGGLLHAVAYGMIFDSLGRAASETLASRGDLRPAPAAESFEELLSENLESGAGHFAKLVASQVKRGN